MLSTPHRFSQRVSAFAGRAAAVRRTARSVAVPRLLCLIFVGMVASFAWYAGAQQPATQTSAQSADEGQGTAGAALRQMLTGKLLYLRGGYLDDSLHFDDRGILIGNSPQGSYTLSIIKVDKVYLTKHKVEIEGVRYGLHFLGVLSSQNSTDTVDRVRITPRKKRVKITIGRTAVVKPRRKKNKAKAAGNAPGLEPASSTTTTTSPAYAAKVLTQAIDNVFAFTLDARMKAAMPAFWKLYYQDEAANKGFQPAEPGVLREDQVDRKARLIEGIHAHSNAYAQACGIAGLAFYYAVIGTDGKPEEVAVAHPIGFGLDENAVEAISKARFEPAMKDGKPVPVLLDMVVEFRIYAEPASPEAPPRAN